MSCFRIEKCNKWHKSILNGWKWVVLEGYVCYPIIEKCNKWHKSIPGSSIVKIQRTFYLNKLISRKHNGLVKVITGIRRCGKSYLLNNLFYEHLLTQGVAQDHIIRFAFDAADDLTQIGEDLIQLEKRNKKVNPQKFIEYINQRISDQEMYYLLLDEIQLLDCFEAVLNGYLRRSNLDIYVTGSNAKLLSSEIATEFAGRGDEIHMYPLSFAEFMTVYQGDKYEGLNDFMLYGGIPIVVLRPDATSKVEMLESLLSEIYIRDLTIRNKIRNSAELEDLLNILSSSIGSLTNPEKLKNTFQSVKKSKITAATIKKYLGYLEDSFLVESVHRYNIKGRSYIETPKKYYFSDLGLRNARINFRQFEQTHALENVIYNELRLRGYRVDVGVVPIVERDAEGRVVRKQLEIDFICNLGSTRYYIQSAYSLPKIEKVNQEVRPLRQVNDSFKKIIITKDLTPSHVNEYGIQTINVYDFLLDPQSLER